MSTAEFKQIKIDFEVHQLIELERKGFHESENDALRRLLRLESSVTKKPALDETSTGSWEGKGVTLPNGTELKMQYGGVDHSGKVLNGRWVVDGRKCTSPSNAARLVSGGTSLNGWLYWLAKRPGDTHWILINSLRAK